MARTKIISSVSSSILDDDVDACKSRGQPLATHRIHDKHTRLNICLRGDDKIQSPNPLDKTLEVTGRKASAKRSSIELKGDEVSILLAS